MFYAHYLGCSYLHHGEESFMNIKSALKTKVCRAKRTSRPAGNRVEHNAHKSSVHLETHQKVINANHKKRTALQRWELLQGLFEMSRSCEELFLKIDCCWIYTNYCFKIIEISKKKINYFYTIDKNFKYTYSQPRRIWDLKQHQNILND